MDNLTQDEIIKKAFSCFISEKRLEKLEQSNWRNAEKSNEFEVLARKTYQKQDQKQAAPKKSNKKEPNVSYDKITLSYYDGDNGSVWFYIDNWFENDTEEPFRDVFDKCKHQRVKGVLDDFKNKYPTAYKKMKTLYVDKEVKQKLKELRKKTNVNRKSIEDLAYPKRVEYVDLPDEEE